MHSFLLILDPAGPTRFPLRGVSVRVGRSPECDLRIDDRSLSRDHAILRQRGDHWTVQDQGSRNGTVVNGEGVDKERELKDGDQIQLGKIMLVYREPERTVQFREDTREDAMSEGTLVLRSNELYARTTDVLTSADRNILEVVSRISTMLMADTGSALFYEKVLADACNEVRADRGALLTVDPETDKLKVMATKIGKEGGRLVLSSTITKHVLKERTSVLTGDALRDPRFDEAKSIIIQGVRSAMCVPLWHEEDVMGLLYADRLLSAKPFTEIDLTILTVLANLTAAKLYNLRLLEEAAAKRRLEEELRLAGEIQRALLPREDLKVEGFDIMGRTYPCRTVGGDLYDFVQRPSGFGFLVGDVSGKGVSASLLMAALQANLRAFLKVEKDLVTVFREVNDAIFQSSAANKFATVFYGEVDPKTGRGRYVNAGHNTPMLVRASGSIELLEDRSIMVGAFPTVKPHVPGNFEMKRGDVLFIYSDGVTELENDQAELYGEERLKQALLQCSREGAMVIHDRIMDALTAFRGGTPPHDDTTFLIVKRL